jgi:UTP--glucose-1-phosphate uridylyltransferase
LITKCLFPAAGYGTRFLPATKAVPKEMLPILNKPLLQYGVEEALSAGINNMAIVTGRGKRSIEDHFDNSFELESQLRGTNKEHYLDQIKKVIEDASFAYIRQHQMLGLGDAILTGEPLIGKESFAVLLADDLCDAEGDGILAEMINIFNKYKCSIIAIQEVSLNEVEKYGIISGELLPNSNNIYGVNDLIEKPKIDLAPSNLAIIGRYILTHDIFDILRNIEPDHNQEIQLTSALLEQAKKGGVLAYKFEGERFDCGNIEGYMKANNFFYNKIK